MGDSGSPIRVRLGADLEPRIFFSASRFTQPIALGSPLLEMSAPSQSGAQLLIVTWELRQGKG